MAVTAWPSLSRRMAACEPMKPAPPVTMMCMCSLLCAKRTHARGAQPKRHEGECGGVYVCVCVFV